MLLPTSPWISSYTCPSPPPPPPPSQMAAEPLGSLLLRERLLQQKCRKESSKFQKPGPEGNQGM